MKNQNLSIGCSVSNCEHHNENACCCSLDKIQVGTHEANPTMDQCTDCQSFQMK